ncbi:MAG: hypothetical protein ACJAYC_000587 [Halieaceae bacterium]|jgi:hypothetical protein
MTKASAVSFGLRVSHAIIFSRLRLKAWYMRLNSSSTCGLSVPMMIRSGPDPDRLRRRIPLLKILDLKLFRSLCCARHAQVPAGYVPLPCPWCPQAPLTGYLPPSGPAMLCNGIGYCHDLTEVCAAIAFGWRPHADKQISALLDGVPC